MKSQEYWQKRFTAIEAQNNKTARSTVHSVTTAFDKAQAQIEKELNAWYARFADNNQITLQEAKRLLNTRELKEFRWDVEKYIEMGQQNALDQKWLKELENASARVHVSRLEALRIRTQQAAELAFGNELDALDQMAARMYTDDYYHTAYEIQRGLGIGWDIGQIDQRRLDNVLSKPWTADKLTFSDRIWKSKTQLLDSLQTEFTQMCILGKAPDETIKVISHKMNVSKGQAGRLIMTEAAYFSSAAQKDCFNDLDVEKFEVVATLDRRTSETCQHMDGQVFDMKDFQIGVTAPPFHVWCRTCTAPWFEDNDDGTRAARGEDGKTYQVPANMKYQDWKDHFVDKTKDPDKWLKTATVGDVATPAPVPQPITITDCTVGSEKYGLPNGSGGVKKTVDVVTYTTPDGTKFIFPKKYNKKQQTMTPEQAIECWGKVPENIRKKAQKEIVFVDYYNPADSYWRKKYKNFTHSYATGGDQITFYRHDYPHDLDYVVRTYCHEAGHFIDKNLATTATRFSLEIDWINAMNADRISSGKKSPTDYGKNSPVEDFAESVAEFTKDPIAFEQEFPERAKLLIQILK